MRIAIASLTVLALTLIVAGTARSAPAHPDGIDSTDSPTIKRINYWEGDAVEELESIVIEADKVKVKVIHGAKAARAFPRPEQKKGSRRKWELNAGFGDEFPGTRDVTNLAHEALAAAGGFTVKVVARNEAGTTRVKERIVAAECDRDPPIYPYDCTVKP